MIKASGNSADGLPLIVLGLSRRNTEKLLDGQPIPVRTSDVDPRLPDIRILVMAGETEDVIATELQRYAR